ncbi:MAG TPA: XisH family protein [Blastocatellia bacterium]|nr:XisH family protein [Blastocatellia bacterium]HMX29729.1 XisH family protein [Blastocatellia bacterium]HMY72552.1 XisH family protein [Blastocatellia bacterium]HMZ22703.1 XisH family protein [Blastocatellia bacterium]HNG30343.1 XisH family protein [Blastocatellia bacterium]
MPAKDLFHEAVKAGLEKAGWTITNDPFRIQVEDSEAYIDLAAERLIAAQKGEEKIAVEIKSFVGRSRQEDFHQALGQFLGYRIMLAELEPNRVLYLAVPADAYQTYFGTWLPRKAIAQHNLKIVVYDPAREEILEWRS